jgi:hypothetical protein
VIYALVLLVAAALTLPVQFVGVGNSFTRWMEGRDGRTHWRFAIFGGFLAVHKRFMVAPPWLRIPLFLSVLYTLFCPTLVFTLDGAISVLYTWGYISDGTSIFSFWGLRFNAMFVYFIVMPILAMVSGYQILKERRGLFVVDVVFYVASFAGWGWVLYSLVHMYGFLSGLTSPLFVFIAVYLHVALHVWGVRNFHQRIEEFGSMEFLSSLRGGQGA